MQTITSMEIYNDLQQFQEFFSSLLAEDRSESPEVDTDFDLESFVDESWAV